uniref:Anticodon-binding domain-containing protein n=1 Tax=Aegilops tauschii subsp. strangulata TaxID=200361 RepID=A0A453AX41_AEGTS
MRKKITRYFLNVVSLCRCCGNVAELILALESQVIRASVTEVLVSILGKDLILAAELANELWSAGIKAEFKLTTRELDHIKYVTQTGIPWMVLVGQGELEMWPPLYGQWLCRLSVFGVCRRVCSASTRIFSALL